jgi:aminoglycoside phosphotransferase (APT) family kinase protein
MARLDAISERLGEVLGEPLEAPARRLSSGASRETFAFTTARHGALVVQIARERDRLAATPAHGPLLEAAAAAGVPVARVVAQGTADPVLGPSWTVVEALPGTTDPSGILAGEDVPPPAELIDGIAAALAAVHRIPADPGLAPAVEDPLTLLRAMHDSLGEPHPTFELAFAALQRTRPAASERALVHGDFRMGNLMIAADGLSGVLDWELAHLGDPVEDLGWLCVPAWRFGRPHLPAAGLGTREQLIAAYERHAGIAVDTAALRWWELAGTLRWGVICVMQAFVDLSGTARSIEHAVIGRRACEVEWDLLALLDPAPVEPAARSERTTVARGTPRPRLHDRPTATELLASARSALGDQVLPGLQGRAAFELRVSLRALGIVLRELELAERDAVLHREVLAGLGVGDEVELAAAIREGRFAEREPELLEALRATVRAKLEVANPAYLESSGDQPPSEEP